MNLNGTFRVLRCRPLQLWLLTLVLWLPWLGNLPLRDWDESLVATVARSTVARSTLARAGQDPSSWLLAFKWDEAYLNKPPGLHWLIGGMLQQFGEAEWAIRLMPCLLASVAVPLLYLLRRALDPSPADRGAQQQRERSALMAALVLMTLLPMARHGRLAMLDGTLVTCSLLLWWGWISSRHTHWHALLAGLGSSGVLLLKPPALLGFLLIAIVISAWDRRPWQPAAAAWLGLGCLPGLSWHGWHGLQRGADALVMWGGQGLGRVAGVVGGNRGAWVMPITEVVEGGWPWLLFLPVGIAWAWRHRQQSSGRWELGLLIGSAALVLPLRTQLPWYSHLLWPPIALLCGEGLSVLLTNGRPRWVGWGIQMLGISSLLLALITVLWPQAPDGASASLVLAGTGLLLGGGGLRQMSPQARRRGLGILLLGWGLALLTLWQSQLWLWELNESWDPRPIASRIQQLPPDAIVELKGPTRPSLGWYAGRELQRPGAAGSLEHWLISKKPSPGCLPVRNAPAIQDATPSEPGTQWKLWYCQGEQR